MNFPNKRYFYTSVDEDTKTMYFTADTLEEVQKRIKESKDAPKNLKIYKVKTTFKYRLLNV